MAASQILYVEDSVTSQLILKRQLKDLGEVTACKTLADGISELRKRSFALVITDWYLPDGKGLEMAHELRGKNPPDLTPVLLVSASLDRMVINQALRAGVNDCISKPLNFEVVTNIVGKMLEQPYFRKPEEAVTVTLVEGSSDGQLWIYCPEIDLLVKGTDPDALRKQVEQQAREHMSRQNHLPRTGKITTSQHFVEY